MFPFPFLRPTSAVTDLRLGTHRMTYPSLTLRTTWRTAGPEKKVRTFGPDEYGDVEAARANADEAHCGRFATARSDDFPGDYVQFRVSERAVPNLKVP
jgi:hypothetical protein